MVARPPRPTPTRTRSRTRIDLEYDKEKHFVVHIDGDNDREAYRRLLDITEAYDYSVFRAATRGYRRLMRPASTPIGFLIQSRLNNAVPDNPIFAVCVKAREWIFFGAYPK